jgi:two-component system, OmpR family, KDP operon response regulator KdpE
VTKARILVVEDEADIRRFVRMTLEREGMEVFDAATAHQARMIANHRKPQLAIVDLGLPDEDGKAFIRDFRRSSAAPLVVLSARERESEKVAALDAGADDYLVKPFGVPELLARVRAQLRRASFVPAEGPPSSVILFGKVRVDLNAREVTRDDKRVHLTRLEYRLLETLIRGQGKVITHHQILREMWGDGFSERIYYVRVYMMNLRHKLEENPAQPQYLTTELQVGYRLVGTEIEQDPLQGTR